MTGAISQMQMAYNPEEDRILFRVNSSDDKEFRFWLTRRFSILMLKVLREHLDRDPDVSTQGTAQGRQAVKEFKQEKAMSMANFSEQFRENNKELPQGDDIKVAFKLTYNLAGDNLQLGIQPRQGQGINMAINREINLSITRLLLAAAKKGDWQLDERSENEGLGQTDSRVIN